MLTGFDALGRVVTVTNAAQGVVSTTYDKDGNVLSTRDEMGNVTANVWNARNELIQQTLPDPDGAGPLAAPVWQWTYDLDARQLTATDPLNRVTSQTWDKLGRLTLVILPDPDGAGPLASPTIATAYDNISRKISQTNALSGTTTYAYANADESLVTSLTAPDPDGSGPLTAAVTRYGYNANGQQVTVVDAMNHTTTTTLDADWRPTVVTDNLNHATTAGTDTVIDQEAMPTPGQAGADGWALTDNLNTPRSIINDSSAVIDHIMAISFGQVTNESNTSIAHWSGFQGGHVDAFAGLVNDYHRWYDPAVGRWLSQDPLGFAAGDANTMRAEGKERPKNNFLISILTSPEPVLCN